MELARNLVECKVLLQEFLQQADLDSLALAHAVEAGAGLTADLVLDADNGDLIDARELVDELLDLARVDVLAHADDHVLDAVDDEVVAVLVDLHHVGRMQPAAAHDIARDVRQVPVAEHDVAAFDDELARLAHGDRVTVRIDDLVFEVRETRADGARDRMTWFRQRDQWRSLGEAVALADVDAEFRLELLLNLHGQRCAARDDDAHGGHVLGLGELREQAADRGDDIEVVDFLLADDRDGLFRREGIEDDRLGAAVERVEYGERPAESVIHRQYAEDMVLAVATDDGDLLAHVDDEVAVREHGALRIARRAGGVDDAYRAVLIELGRQRRGLGYEVVLLAGEADIVLDDGHVAAQLCHGIDEVERLIGQHVLRARILEDVGDFAAAQLEVDGHGDGTQRGDAEVGADVVCAVAGEDGHAVTLAHARRVEFVAAVVHELAQLFIGNAALVVDDGDGVWFTLGY